MHVELDIFKLFMPLNFGFFGITFLLIFLLRKDSNYMLWFAAAYVSAFIGSLIELFHERLDFGPLRFDDISNGLYLFISISSVIGIAISHKKEPPFKALSILFIMGYMCQAYWHYGVNDLYIRILVTDVMASLLMMPVLPILWNNRSNLMSYGLFWCFVIIVANNMIRPIIGIFIIDRNISLETYASEPYVIIFYFISSIVAIAMSFPLLVKVAINIVENYKLETIKDPLTGLLNRRGIRQYFDEYQNDEYLRDKGLYIIQLDLDHFKRINDNYGHTVGDLVLKRCAKTIVSTIQSQGACARFGGEEFIILLPNQTQQVALLLANNIRQKLALVRHPELPADYESTASFGVAAVQKHHELEQAIENADQALYAAKDAGRNMVKAYDMNNILASKLKVA